jgi:hypothetical protein
MRSPTSRWVETYEERGSVEEGRDITDEKKTNLGEQIERETKEKVGVVSRLRVRPLLLVRALVGPGRATRFLLGRFG